VNVERHILGCPLHESRSLWGSTMVGSCLHGTHEGRALNIRYVKEASGEGYEDLGGLPGEAPGEK